MFLCVAVEEVEAKLERALKEIGQLKIDREVAIDKREKQVTSCWHDNTHNTVDLPSMVVPLLNFEICMPPI
jgi:DNA topoisomerase IA